MATIKEIAGGNPNFSILVSAIGFIDAENGTNYLGTLDDPSQALTVFAPTNAAFGDLAVNLGFAGDPADTGAVTTFLTGLGADTLETVVTYHVAAGVKLSSDIAGSDSITTLQGGTIDTTELPTLGDNEPDLIDPSLIPGLFDIGADNGVVHAIDKVLLPLDFPGNDAPSILEIVTDASGADGFDTVPGDFDFLREALEAAGLDGTFAGAGDFTVFAPTDAAFLGLTQALGYDGDNEGDAFGYLVDALRLFNGGDDPIDLLSTVLTYHVAGQSLQASQVIADGEVTTLQGGVLTLNGLSLEDGEPGVADPSLVATDLQASNGVVHVIDGVLIPVDLPLPGKNNKIDLEIGDGGRDHISTGRGNDLIDGNGGNDVIWAGSGSDVAVGGSGNDWMAGQSGKDILFGDEGRDKIFGGSGKDVINGGEGTDWMSGGWGRDTFVFENGSDYDVVIDFRNGKDKIDLSGYMSGDDYIDFSDIEVIGSWFSSRIELEDGDNIRLLGVRKHDLDESDFIFADDMVA